MKICTLAKTFSGSGFVVSTKSRKIAWGTSMQLDVKFEDFDYGQFPDQWPNMTWPAVYPSIWQEAIPKKMQGLRV